MNKREIEAMRVRLNKAEGDIATIKYHLGARTRECGGLIFPGIIDMPKKPLLTAIMDYLGVEVHTDEAKTYLRNKEKDAKK